MEQVGASENPIYYFQVLCGRHGPVKPACFVICGSPGSTKHFFTPSIHSIHSLRPASSFLQRLRSQSLSSLADALTLSLNFSFPESLRSDCRFSLPSFRRFVQLSHHRRVHRFSSSNNTIKSLFSCPKASALLAIVTGLHIVVHHASLFSGCR